MKTLIINDLHIGVKRRAGATPQSRKDLDKWMMLQFAKLLTIPHDRLIILGDLCDSRTIPEHLMKDVIALLYGKEPYIVLGNHCLGGVGDHTMSSTEFISEMVGCPAINKPMNLTGNLYIVPHMFNQEAHEKAISECPDTAILLTHCNIDSPFSQGDHSLNLSKEEIQDLGDRGVDVVAAHEHARRDYKGVVHIIGNQFPSSISDCLHGNSFACIIEDEEISFIPTWTPEGDYLECDYTEIHNTPHKFIRINGTCSIVEYPAIVREIAQLRKTSDAFIISNNVKVKISETETITAEEVTNFNILELLLERIGEEFREDIKSCI